MAYKVTVDRKKCNGCEECLEVCTGGMFRMDRGKAVPSEDVECMGCETCMEVCDQKAITITASGVTLSSTFMNLMSVLDDDEEEETRKSNRA
jgi:Fe-S-cluster-containing hydrogenase component 2